MANSNESGVVYDTPYWSIQRLLEVDPHNLRCKVVTGATKYPAGATELEIELWNASVIKKMNTLNAEGKLELTLGDVEGRYALKGKLPGEETLKNVMTPGFQYRLIDYNETENIVELERVIYSEGEALKNDSYRQLFIDAGLPLPHGPLGPVLMLKTSDNKIASIKRGTGTNKYPGAIWGIGGDIDNPSLSVGEHLTKVEVKEEIATSLSDRTKYEVLGIVYDKVLKKHDLPVLASTELIFGAIQKGIGYLPDVANMEGIPFEKRLLSNYLAENSVATLAPDDQAWIGKLSSPWTADLILAGRKEYGPEWAEEIMSRLYK